MTSASIYLNGAIKPSSLLLFVAILGIGSLSILYFSHYL